MLRPTDVADRRPDPSSTPQEIVANARAEAAHTKDEAGRSSLLLHAKRDLYLLALDGVVGHLRRSSTPDAGAVAEAVRDTFDDMCDDWRELVEHGRQEAVDLARAASHARQAREAAEASASELYAVAKRLEEDLVAAKAENAALKQEMRALVEEERAADASGKDEKAIPAKKSGGWFGGGGARKKPAPKMANENTQTSNLPSGQSTPTVRSSPVKGLSVRFNESALEEAIKATPTAPSSASPGTALGLRGRAPPSPVKPTPPKTPLSPKDFTEMVASEAARRNPVASEGRPAPRWAMDTASAASSAAAAKTGGPWSSGQFGPSTPAAASVTKQLAKATVSSERTRSGARKWTLKQLKEVIDDVCGAKSSNDARRAKHRQAKETLRQHLYTYLNHKFGVKSVINDWADSIIAATDKFQDDDCDVAAFGRALRNLVDEEYLRRGKAIATTVRDMLRAYLASKHPHLNDQQLAQRHREKMEGDLFDDEWLDMVRFMYAPEEQPAIVDAVRSRQDEIRVERGEPSSPPEDNAPGTRRRSKAEIEAARRKRERRRVPFSQFIQVCLFHGLDAREDVIAPFAEAVARLGGDALSSGTVTEKQFIAVAERTRPELGEGDVEKMMLRLDPWNNDSVTVSDLYLALVPGLADDDDAASDTFAGKGSSIFALGGVGHGELFVGTYEGNKFKPMYR